MERLVLVLEIVLIGIPKEIAAGERRVAAAPENVAKFIKLGFEVVVEADAGQAAKFPDALYEEAGATVLSTADVWAKADILLKIRPPQDDEVELAREGATLISLIQPAQNGDLLERLAGGPADQCFRQHQVEEVAQVGEGILLHGQRLHRLLGLQRQDLGTDH